MSIETDQQQIQHLIQTWVKASAENDLDTVLSLMAEDVVFLLPGRPPMRGRADFAAASKSMEGKMRIEGRPEIQEITVMGNYAFCWNHLTMTVTPLPNGPPMHRSGDILSVFRRESDGRWVLFRDANLLVTVS